MSAKIVQLRKGETDRNATNSRLPNNVYRIREHLTEAETDKLLAALKAQPTRPSGLADRSGDLPARSARVRVLRSAITMIVMLHAPEETRNVSLEVKL
jgi:hypothetical protein